MCHKPFFGHLSIHARNLLFHFVPGACFLRLNCFIIFGASWCGDGRLRPASAIRITGIERYWLYDDFDTVYSMTTFSVVPLPTAPHHLLRHQNQCVFYAHAQRGQSHQLHHQPASMKYSAIPLISLATFSFSCHLSFIPAFRLHFFLFLSLSRSTHSFIFRVMFLWLVRIQCVHMNQFFFLLAARLGFMLRRKP